MSIISSFSEYIRSVALFIIFMTLAEVILPKSRYKGYISLTLGFVLILIVLGPLQGILGGFSGAGATARLTGALNRNAMTIYAAGRDEAQRAAVAAEFKNLLAGQIKEEVNRGADYSFVSADIEVDMSEENFGGINSISITVSEKEAEPEKKSFIRVEPVTVEPISAFSPPREESAAVSAAESAASLELKKSVSGFYNLSSNNIYITVIDK